MRINYVTERVGPSANRSGAIDLGIVHTTEGQEVGNLGALTTTVSAHKYIARSGRVYILVPLERAALHAGWGRLRETDEWSSGWNNRSVGWEIGHKAGEPWNPELLARALHVIRADTQRLRLPQLLRHKDIAQNRPFTLPNGAETGGPRSDPTDFPFWESFRSLCLREPYDIKGAPDIDPSVFEAKVQAIFDSDQAFEAYQSIVDRGFRPGPMLALLGITSDFGTAGVAAATRSWGAVSTPMDDSRVVGMQDGFPVFRSWQDSLDDVMDRLDSPEKPYCGKGNTELATVRCIWAPVGNGTTDPFNEALKMRSWIEDWRRQAQPIPRESPLPPGTVPVDSRFRQAWEASGGIWLPTHLTPGFATSPAFQHNGRVVQRFQRSVASLDGDGIVSWLLLSEIATLP